MKKTPILLVLFLAACDPGPTPPPKVARTPNPAFETQIQAMEKARAVDGQVMDATEAQRKQIEQATQQ
jgi:hypothetical protein